MVFYKFTRNGHVFKKPRFVWSSNTASQNQVIETAWLRISNIELRLLIYLFLNGLGNKSKILNLYLLEQYSTVLKLFTTAKTKQDQQNLLFVY